MKIILVLFILIISFASTAFSYPESQMNECVSSSLNNPSIKLISKNAITNYCDCFLKETIDAKKNIRDSGYECALKNFK
tara:strand:- start:137 stop:373 length:237 start_codon:yes stop_codon:yes gene_type:complete